MREYLLDAFDAAPFPSTISKTLRRLGITKKKLKVVAAQRSEILQEDWRARVSRYQPEQLMFLDEGACCDKTTSWRAG